MNDTKSDRTLNQLGLPPMELAESTTNGRSSRSIYTCMFSTLQKVFLLLLLVTFSTGAYILLLKLLENADNSRNTEIILVTGTKETANITLHKKDMDIFFHLYNKTTATDMKRRKRSTDSSHENEGRKILEKLKPNEINRVKEIIKRHGMLCQQNEHKDVCKELIAKLKNIIHNHKAEANSNIQKNPDKSHDKIHLDHDHVKFDPNEVKKRETFPLAHHLQNVVRSNPMALDVHPPGMVHVPGTPQLADTCLLAKLLKDKYPHVHGIYDAPADFPTAHDHHAVPQMRFFPPSVPSYLQDRGRETHKPIIHPQDLDIFMSFLTQKPDVLEPTLSDNSTSRNVNCPPGKRACKNNGSCVEEKLWCDGEVHCGDSSDEVTCSCKSRVDSSRLCDGYNDCPLGEDEMGCFGCGENMFSCEDIGTNSKTSCYTKEQRCNNVMDCPNNKDETDCNMLAPSLLRKTMFSISSTEGFLHRNFKGDWYAVCTNPYMWAHDACRRETGLIIRPPFIQFVPIDPLEKVNYINTGPNSIVQPSDTCFNHSAVYVTCPDFLCGTRVPTTSQLLKQNAENHLFGRNKRYSFPTYPYDPYYMMYGGNRMKRDVSTKDDSAQDVVSIFQEINQNENKKTESRVVGGKPSQPAAWPWIVAMYRDGMFHCGGVILTQSWIISAAHCVSKFWDHYYEIQVGMLRRFSFSPQEQIHRVTHVIVNQHYRQADMKNDLSLLRVEPSIQFSRWVRPICLPGVNTAGPDWYSGPAPGTVCTAVGWGATAEHGPDPDHMREVEVPVWNKCKHREDISGREICAGIKEGGKDACQGDSGGPLLCRNPLNSQQWYIAGIVSHGDGCGRKGEPGVYTRVSLFVKWIKYHISSQNLPIVQPMQDCPGFRCKTGIFKCIPNNRKCDKIVDCLGAEDESNCDFSLLSNLLLEAKSSEKFSRDTDFKESIKTDILTHFENVTETADISTTEKSEIDKNNNKTENLEPNTSKNNADFAHASTLEISISKSEEDSISSSHELATESPKSSSSSIESSELDRGDMQTIAITPETLESRSVVKDMTNSRTVDEENKKTMKNEITTTEFANIEVNTDRNHFQKKSDEFVIDFLPKLDKNMTENDTDPNNNDNNDQNMSESKTINSVQAKNLPEAESKSNVIQKIEDLVFSELQPATRRRHNTPKDFECRRIFQMVPFTKRCDRKADCEDGTDELDCSCIDYLYAYNENLLCDGIFDCADGQDEVECFSCPEQHFLCKRSEICLPTKYVCDGITQCPSGEDEFNCFALTNGREIFYDIDEKPKINFEGYLTEKTKNDWQIVCEEDLTVEQQEESATHICHYLGFSSANNYLVKYFNMKNNIARSSMEATRKKRQSVERAPIQLAYRSANANNTTSRKVITEPQLLKEECVPNVTKTCKTLYVYCDRSLFTDFIIPGDLRNAETAANIKKNHEMWPWIAKVYMEGDYKCTGILVDLSWVLVSDSCLWELTSSPSYVTVILGSHRTLDSVKSYHEKVHKVDFKKYLYRSRSMLLHLSKPAEYSNMVKPMVSPSHDFYFNDNQKKDCVAIGQDGNNNTISVFVNETNKNCNLSNRCFIRQNSETICPSGMKLNRQWAGLIACHNDQGWYPAASFVDSRGECGIGEHINATDIENFRHEIKHITRELSSQHLDTNEEFCDGVRCSRGLCVRMNKMCDGVTHCEDGRDESVDSCQRKLKLCNENPHHKWCECSKGQLKCKNGKCVSKELFGDGKDDCGDSTDEPRKSLCSDYLARVMPSRLCDGVLHCHDKSDEDPMYCKCFAKKTFQCSSRSTDTENCVAPDMVCDGIRDCPNGEDERKCIGLSAIDGAPTGTGQVLIQSHGVWRSKCYSSPNHTKSELEDICMSLGFISGHAKEIKDVKNLIVNPHNNLIMDQFVEVSLNNQTRVKIRNSDEPIAKAVVDTQLKDCYPVFIECL